MQLKNYPSGDKKFDSYGKNWFIKFSFDDNRNFGTEFKPEMNLSDIIVELIKFANLLIINIGN